MKREEALNKYPHGWMEDNSYNDYPKDDIVNLIYDDFESRTCKNCKHSGLYTKGWMPCLHPENEYHIKEVHDDFGCNKWEAR